MRVNSVVVELNNHFFVPILGGTGAVGVDEEVNEDRVCGAYRTRNFICDSRIKWNVMSEMRLKCCRRNVAVDA